MSLASISPVGDTIRLDSGAVLQRPNPELITALAAEDSRVRYFPTDLERAQRVSAALAYLWGVSDLLPAQIMRDFPGPRERTAQRGTVVSLRDEFPHFKEFNGFEEVTKKGKLPKRKFTGNYLPMNNVLTILKTGSDRGGRLGKRAVIDTAGQLDRNSQDWLVLHTEKAIEELLAKGEIEKANNLFPGLLVYDQSRLSVDSHGHVEDPSSLIAIYVTDRVVNEEWDALLPDSVQSLCSAALEQSGLDAK